MESAMEQNRNELAHDLEVVPTDVETQVNLPCGMDRADVIEFLRGIDKTGQLSWPQVKVFLSQCHDMRLDPRRRQIYAIPRWNKHTQRNELTTVVSIDGFRLVAERTGKYAPGQPTQYLRDKDGNLCGATVFVKKQTADGTWHEVSETAFLFEYKPKQNPGSFWQNMPSVMIAKVAEMRALRRAFPDTFSGIYGQEEMDQAQDLPKTDPKPEPEKIEADDAYACIDSETYDKLLEFIGEDTHLIAQIQQLCGISDLRQMHKGQRRAVAEYIEKQRGLANATK